MGVLLVVLAAVAAVAVLVYLVDRLNPAGQGANAEDGPMPVVPRRILVGYLLVVGVGLVYMLASLASADFPDTPVQLAVASAPPSPSPSPTAAPSSTAPSPSRRPSPTDSPAPALTANPTPTDTPGPAVSPTAAPTPSPSNAPSRQGVPPASPAPGTPVLKQVFPLATLGSVPTSFLTVYGEGFVETGKEKTVVRFNRNPRLGEFLAPGLIKAQLEAEDLQAGSMIVDVANGERVSNAVIVSVGKPRVPVNVFGGTRYMTREIQLLLLVIFAGALGSYVHAVKSLTDFIGNRTATASWFWWYITRPFLGAAMALIFYAVLRGGFLAGSPADAKVVNHFGVIAIGALVGMFADKASQKLAEIFDTLFTSPDNRSGKLAVPVIDKVEPPILRPGTPVDLVLKGDRLGKVTKVHLNSDDRSPDTVSEKEVKVKLRAEDVAEPREIKVSAVNPDRGVSPAVSVFVSDLKIDTASLPEAKVGAAYDVKLAASGGSGSYKWKMSDGPSWLKTDEPGQMKGTPSKAGSIKVTVRVTDEAGASVAATFDLKVT
jgi:putative Ig domain-containing protein